jgi:hypothetical protein
MCSAATAPMRSWASRFSLSFDGDIIFPDVTYSFYPSGRRFTASRTRFFPSGTILRFPQRRCARRAASCWPTLTRLRASRCRFPMSKPC